MPHDRQSLEPHPHCIQRGQNPYYFRQIGVFRGQFSKEDKASAHIVLARDGTIFQLAPFNYRTWHAGESFFNGRSGYNHFSIGIEIDPINFSFIEKRLSQERKEDDILKYRNDYIYTENLDEIWHYKEKKTKISAYIKP